MDDNQPATLAPAETPDTEQPWRTMLDLATSGDADALDDYVSQLSTADQALALSHLDDQETHQVLETLHANDAAELLSHLPEVQAAQLIGSLEAASAAAIIQELPSDEQADVLGDLNESQLQAILNELPAEEAAAARELAAYNDDVAGGLMICELLRFSDRMSVAQVIEQLSHDHQRHDDMDIRYGYVCDDAGRLVGVLRMHNLLFARRSASISDVMIHHPVSVADSAPLDELVELFESHAYLGVPVVDSEGVLQGVVRREAVDYESVRAAESDYLKSQGIVGGEELRTMPLWLRSRRRLSWLSVNIVLNIGAAAVIATFQDTLQSVIALAVFLPIISDMSGCSGNQAVAVSMRELSLGLIRPSEFFRVWSKEIAVGLINGSILGLLVGIVALVFSGNVYLGLVVGGALTINTMVAVSIGGLIPLCLKKMGVDPAVASGPLLTTVTDMCGFFLVLGFATMMLTLLV
ncbi:magnesium transporter [Stieleria sp. TO1_6]|uniref:magnesium transporter n=1 Tax=Stieleria tagensis TaxID=2956795 RepID=UPI00209B81C7|nr:magnesium transporter [Stieleria tagensis]MCO8120114.1 magnesium transporter [Stieleria tagensis]